MYLEQTPLDPDLSKPLRLPLSPQWLRLSSLYFAGLLKPPPHSLNGPSRSFSHVGLWQDPGVASLGMAPGQPSLSLHLEATEVIV